ncbi:MAG: hypothetical protein HY337_07005 [Gemmatimonadetes bacterium]|nr:hypothetical protein [Gemmatimonadota bacterium]
MASPFDHRPDPEVGAALRELLSSGDDAAFAERVTAAATTVLGREMASGWWEVLGAWARPGVAAAVALAASATLWLAVASVPADSDVTIEDALRRTGETVATPVLVAATSEPDLERLMWDVPDPE